MTARERTQEGAALAAARLAIKRAVAQQDLEQRQAEEMCLDIKRLRFARWLYQQGKISI